MVTEIDLVDQLPDLRGTLNPLREPYYTRCQIILATILSSVAGCRPEFEIAEVNDQSKIRLSKYSNCGFSVNVQCGEVPSVPVLQLFRPNGLGTHGNASFQVSIAHLCRLDTFRTDFNYVFARKDIVPRLLRVSSMFGQNTQILVIRDLCLCLYKPFYLRNLFRAAQLCNANGSGKHSIVLRGFSLARGGEAGPGCPSTPNSNWSFIKNVKSRLKKQPNPNVVLSARSELPVSTKSSSSDDGSPRKTREARGGSPGR
ncbi:hypothetical protein M405DRAFT_878895 [Rhizopogon salebrosus TDB-379]|nr:hypothetical protein M405DRAFT_878895 [Rhizopogon salebrosus TDB-379]